MNALQRLSRNHLIIIRCHIRTRVANARQLQRNIVDNVYMRLGSLRGRIDDAVTGLKFYSFVDLDSIIAFSTSVAPFAMEPATRVRYLFGHGRQKRGAQLDWRVTPN